MLQLIRVQSDNGLYVIYHLHQLFTSDDLNNGVPVSIGHVQMNPVEAGVMLSYDAMFNKCLCLHEDEYNDWYIAHMWSAK